MKIIFSVTDESGNTVDMNGVELNPCNQIDQSRIQAIEEICKTAICDKAMYLDDDIVSIDSIVFED
jgi:hypothetical protein